MMQARYGIYIILLLGILPKQGFAYIDPGAGSVLLQLLVAGSAGLLVLLKAYWNKLSLIFKKKNNANASSINSSYKDNQDVTG